MQDDQSVSAPSSAVTAAQPTGQPLLPTPTPDAAPDQQPRLWQRILTGALAGLAGAQGAKNFGGGLTGGAAGGLAYIQQQKDNKIKTAEAQSRIKFQDAQSASLAAETAIRDKQLHNMDQEQQDTHNANALEQLKTMQGLGLQPTLVVDNHAQGATAGLQQLTDSHGAVPPLFTINLGDKIVGFDLGQLSQTPQALNQVNKIRALQGQQPFDPKTWAQLPAQAKNDQTNAAFSFFNPMPSEEGLQVYTNYLNTAKAGPDSPDKAANVAKLQGVVTRMQTALDSQNARANQQLAAKTSAEELAKQNTPQGRATLAKTLAEATKAKADAAGAGTDKMWAEGKNPITGESLNLSNAPNEMLIDSRTNQPVPFKMLSTLKPTQQESNRSDFAGSVLHSLDQIDQLRAAGKLPNGPLSGLTAKALSKAGLGDEDAQKAMNFISFAQSAATGAHVGGRFSSEIMDKMNHMIGINMNDSQFKGAEDSIRNVMDQYVKQGGRQTVGQFKQDMLGSVVSVKGQRVKVTGFDKNGNIQGVPVQ
jgi:hypothetical protein